MNSDEFGEKLKTKPSKAKSSGITLQQAIDFGEYHPEVLSTFPDFLILSPHAQFQLIRQALDNKNRQLVTQWAEINNFLDFSKKPELKEALDNLNKQIKNLENEREEIYLAYSKL
ncbi:MAG TPA: hypothetical protein VLE44_00010 [Candidatus Saccharimonadales bacterium]|nr:hypothetical protein [Candidatus Saccharimonadales bacterium]